MASVAPLQQADDLAQGVPDIHTKTASAQLNKKPKKYLELENVVKKYGDFTALKGISLTIYEGEFISFLGPSGCGKTTLLRAIAGLDYQSSGFLIQAGKDVSEQPPNKRDFGIVFQSYALFPNLSVADNVAYGLLSRKTPRSEIAGRVSELLETVGLPDSEKKYPSQLSGGQQQRVALARAIATKPGLLLLDEPLSALDAQVRTHLRTEIKALQEKLGLTTIMVTHDQEEAITMADRIVVMNHGVIEQVGTPEEIYQEPATAFVAKFIGTTNLLPCSVDNDQQVDLGGIKLTCSCPSDLIGKPACLAIRPEDIVIRNVLPSEVNTEEFEVKEIEYMGPMSRVQLVHLTGIELIAEFSRNDMREMAINIGDLILAKLAQVRIFPEESA